MHITITIENIILVSSVLLFISIIAGRASYRLGIPTLVLFLGVGMLAGVEGIGGIKFTNPEIVKFIGVISLNFILFSGGINTNWKYIKPIFWRGLSVSTLGVIITAASVGVFIYYISDFSLLEGLLLGAIVSSTDAAAVLSILRAKSLALVDGLRPTIEMESGSNDPMAYVLTISILSLIVNPETSYFSAITFFFEQMILGGIFGFLCGVMSKYIINHIELAFEGLYSVLVIALMLITFSFTDFIGGNGFLAVYICGVYLGSNAIFNKVPIIKMFDGIVWLMEIILFLILGLFVTPSKIIPVLGTAALVAVFLILIARPLSIFLSLIPFKVPTNAKLYISWAGLRGAVPIVFATYPLLAGIENAVAIFDIVFFVSIISILVQGTTLSNAARWFKVALPDDQKKIRPTDILLSEHPEAAMQELQISGSSPVIGKKIMELNLPESSIIAMIYRNDKYITPRGSTEIKEGDKLMILCDSEMQVEKMYEKLLV